MIGRKVTTHLSKDGRMITDERTLLSADSIRTLEDDRALLITRSSDPIILSIKPFYRSHTHLGLTKIEPIRRLPREISPVQYLPFHGQGRSSSL